MDNTKYIEKLEKFMFFFKLRTTAKEFCCGCRLKTGNLIISVIFIIFLLISFYSVFSTTNFSGISRIILTLMFIIINLNLLVSCILILISTIRFDAKLAYYGYFINSASFYFEMLTFFTYMLLIVFRVVEIGNGQIEDYGVFSYIFVFLMFTVFFILLIFFRVYILWINYSFLIYLAKGEYAFLEGSLEESDVEAFYTRNPRINGNSL